MIRSDAAQVSLARDDVVELTKARSGGSRGSGSRVRPGSIRRRSRTGTPIVTSQGAHKLRHAAQPPLHALFFVLQVAAHIVGHQAVSPVAGRAAVGVAGRDVTHGEDVWMTEHTKAVVDRDEARFVEHLGPPHSRRPPRSSQAVARRFIAREWNALARRSRYEDWHTMNARTDRSVERHISRSDEDGRMRVGAMIGVERGPTSPFPSDSQRVFAPGAPWPPQLPTTG
jgi:hypothetical protein